MSIHEISRSLAPSGASTLLSNLRTKHSAKFSIESHLPQASAGDVKRQGSQISAVPALIRHSAVTPQTKAPAAQADLQPVTAAAALDIAPLPTTLANWNNPTAMWTPASGFLNNGNPIGPLQNPQPQPFHVTNSNYNPADPNSPATIQDPTATAAPQPVQWTSSNGLTTTGVMNPFGLTQNNPALGFFGGQG
jgi:hypothetical protein